MVDQYEALRKMSDFWRIVNPNGKGNTQLPVEYLLDSLNDPNNPNRNDIINDITGSNERNCR